MTGVTENCIASCETDSDPGYGYNELGILAEAQCHVNSLCYQSPDIDQREE